MRVLMLGWEFPPHLSGGIGTACEGLTRALTHAGVAVTFVLPEHAAEVGRPGGPVLTAAAPDRDDAPEPPAPDAAAADLRVADAALADAGAARSRAAASSPRVPRPASAGEPAAAGREAPYGLTVERVDAPLPSAYTASGPADGAGTVAGEAGGRLWGGTASASAPGAAGRGGAAAVDLPGNAGPAGPTGESDGAPGPARDPEIVRQTRRYADACVELASRLAEEAAAAGEPGFDAVHAHDWTTFPAGVAVADALGLPLIAHVHSTAFDRSGGDDAPGPVRDIERIGLSRAARVLAVSRRTREALERRYGVDPARIRVVHNAASPADGRSRTDGDDDAPACTAGIAPDDRVVLFLGRLTAQKGPGYFLDAARAVLEKRPDTTFVVAGSGDRLGETMARVQESGIADRFVFTGFLKGDDVKAVYDRADVYVMPSVSEPFGIAPLDAIQRGVPVIVSKQSGVSEVLDHALKVDFWDTEELANQILAVLNHPTLGATLRAHASVQVRGLTWEGAAERVVEAYEEAVRR
ncbi:glycosyltransferase family 4 protein [Phycisphaera mikurensis]|uniref:starch synthase n=1 Tax=Phycisphaera mikurensis (strain NBRC 102666 / KCTC 22515 / FYK2301M01) TaxID=1142394 RepID=I0IB21_PHYMF|nr:glycosyltransferase family 4 protein [Phycisphaera mikurensis]MBB6442570.1 glycosyltransferase involved in cell wall biosynthesis [Phycisphaera mikurensis]BAM02459.1 putative glycosyltransferase [Phycisphaera mikurensis NBRC 102666]